MQFNKDHVSLSPVLVFSCLLSSVTTSSQRHKTTGQKHNTCSCSYSTCRLGRRHWLIFIRVESNRDIALTLQIYKCLWNKMTVTTSCVTSCKVVKFICYRRNQWHHEVSRSISDQDFIARGYSLHELSPSDLFTVGNCSELTEQWLYLCLLSWMVHLPLLILYQKMQGLFLASHNLR